MKRYEISFESRTESGNILIYAKNEAQARRIFREMWKDSEIPVPTFWISAMWSLS